MKRSIELEQPSDSDEEEYEEMSTQKLKKIIDEGGLSQTTTTQLLGIFVKKVDERDAKLAGKAVQSTSGTDVPTSRLKAVRDAVKARISFEGKDEDMVQDPGFKQAMESLKENPITTMFKGVILPVLWDIKRSRLGFHDPTPFKKCPRGNDVYKCQVDFCWIDEKSPKWNYCVTHSSSQIYFVQDITSNTTTVAIIHPQVSKINGYTDKELNKYSKSATAKTHAISVYNYMELNKKADLRSFQNLNYSTESLLAGEGNHHNKVAMSMMTMMHNSVCHVEDRVKFINQEIIFRNSDGFQKDFFEKLRKVLELNKFIFKITGEKKSTTILPQSLVPTVSYPKLPSSYLARDNNTGEIYSGLRYGMERGRGVASIGHKRSKKTGLTGFDKSQIKRIYQFAHPRADLIKDNNSYTRFSVDEKNIHEEMKIQAHRIETLGHISSLFAQMLGLKINGHDIIFLCQKYQHFDDSFSEVLLNEVFGYMYGEVLAIDIPIVAKDDKGELIWKFLM